jgi:hypothetical protein
MTMTRTSGISLVELVVALLFMGLLLSGMIRVYLASLDSWNRVNQALTGQRALRWSMDRIAEDLRMMGHLFPPPELRSPALSSGFIAVPGQPADELSFVMDAPVPGRALLAETLPALAASVPVRPDRAMRLEAGDLLLVAGERFEFARVERRAALAAGRTGLVPAALTFPHLTGAPVQVVRPLRLVRYAVVPLALEPGGLVPCLVRFETACPKDRATPRWARLLKSPHSTLGSHELVAENISGFRVVRNQGGRIEVRIETRSPIPRSQTLRITPRNFGL